jgi:prolyl oligopeptidase
LSYQITPKKRVTDNYHGVSVVDDYRWLENGNDPIVREWTERQNQHTRAVLNHIPSLEAIRGRVKELMTASTDYFELSYRGGKIFALKSEPPKEQPFLITVESADKPDLDHVILDPEMLSPSGTTSIDFYVPSIDARLVAVSLSEGGSEKGTGYVYEVSSRKRLADVIPCVNYTAGGSLAWNGDGTGFYYTRYPREDERPREDLNFFEQVYFHRLGTPTDEDVYSIGREFPRIAVIQLESSEDGDYVLATVENGDGGEFCHYLLKEEAEWRQITNFADQISAATFGPKHSLYVLSTKDAPRGKILRLNLQNPELFQAETVVQQNESVIDGFEFTLSGLRPKFVAASSGLYVPYIVGGPSEVCTFDLMGHQRKTLAIPPISSVEQILCLHQGEVLLRCQSFIDPPAWYRYLPSTEKIVRTPLGRTSKADLSQAEAVREFATSRDGTKIPISIIRRKDTRLHGANPTILTGYGGFGISVTPWYLDVWAVWLEQGGILAVANLRGGGEYGQEWHNAGRLKRKQNAFDDFLACAEHMIDRKYTTHGKLAVRGGSNGGLLMGAALTQHPELFRAVVSHVGIYDMLRAEQLPNAQYNATEFGTVKDPQQFSALYAYSPYHHVQDGIAYPAVFLLAGENDPRVDAFHSRKMAARLQAASSSDLPVLLYISQSSGHGGNTSLSERIAQQADVLAFLFHCLGMEYKA